MSQQQSLPQVLLSTNKSRIIRYTSAVTAFLSFLGLLFIILAASNVILGLVAISYSFLSSLLAFILAYRKPQLAALFVISTLEIAPLVLFFTNNSLSNDVFLAAYILVPILAGVFGLPRRAIIVISIISGLVLTASFTTATISITPFPYTYLFDWLGIYIIACAGILFFVSENNKAWRIVTDQNLKLRDLSERLSATTESSNLLSQELQGVTLVLSKESERQSKGTQEQVAAISQTTSIMEELNANADSIASNTEVVTKLAEETLDLANVVKEASQQANSAAVAGYESVEQAVSSVQKMREHITQMSGSLADLTEQALNVGKVIDIISEIATETHLLALNASIEAQGGTGDSDNRRVQGERFGVIAQEIKNLSDRSRESAKNMKRSMEQMQLSVENAVQLAEVGRSETFAAVDRSQISGAVIQRLTEMVAISHNQAEQILHAAANVKTLCDEINLTTRQQRSAYQQTLITMREIKRISEDGTESMHQLVETAVRVNDKMNTLSGLLDLDKITID